MNSSSSAENQSPAAFYQARLAACTGESAKLQRQHLALGYLRLFWAVLVLATGYFVVFRQGLPWAWVLLPCVAFGLTARWHATVLNRHAHSRRAVQFYELGLARLEDRWAGLRPRAPQVDASASLYAADLDLFSAGGLFELLCTARTTLGENTLARWLLHPAAPADVQQRQAAVADLRLHTTLREAVASIPGKDPLPVDHEALVAWAESPSATLPRAMRWLAPLLVLLTLAALLRWATGHSALLLMPMLVLDLVITFLLQPRLKPLFAATEQAAGRLALLAEILERLEEEPVTATHLQALQASLKAGPQTAPKPASQAVRSLARLAAAMEYRANYIVRLLDAPLLYSVQLGLLVQSWRTTHAANLKGWLEALGEAEALLSLSAYHFEHPADVFPELIADQPLFAAEGLAHPLLPASAAVRNNVTLDEQTRLLLISGSNMSGKSTLLRSVGVAAVLAMAGAPVRANCLRIGPLHVAASIQINDSLQSGRSHFYAEILRLRAICDLARHDPPVLFLLDELLAGTNSHDRLAGAAGVVETLLATGALGLLSTHDLALTNIGGDAARLVHNAHFEDEVNGNELRFDYTLRDGVVTRSNGLALMRLIGLDV